MDGNAHCHNKDEKNEIIVINQTIKEENEISSVQKNNRNNNLPPKPVIDYYEAVHTQLWEYPHLSINSVPPDINMQPKEEEEQHFDQKGFNQQNEQQTIIQEDTVIMKEELVNFQFEPDSTEEKVKKQNNNNDINPNATSNVKNSPTAEQHSNNEVDNISVNYDFPKMDNSLKTFLDELDSIFMEPNLATKTVESRNLAQSNQENINPKPLLDSQLPSIAVQNNNNGLNTNLDNNEIHKTDTNSPTKIVAPNNLDQNDHDNNNPNPTFNMQLPFDESTQNSNTSSSGTEIYKDATANELIESNLVTESVVPNNLDQISNIQLPFEESTQTINIHNGNTENGQVDTTNNCIETTSSASEVVEPNNLDQIHQETSPKPNLSMELPIAEPSENITL